jgi:hypothetical protein
MIYTVSFPNPNPAPGESQFDTVDTAELPNTKLNDESIREFNDDKTVHIIKYAFTSTHKMPENVEEIFVTATCDTIDESLKPMEKLDIQTFVDEVAKGAYQRKTPDSSEYIIEAKTKLKTIFANKLLENGCLAINSRYDSFGYIYAGDDIVGTFENINITSETELSIDDAQSLIDLEQAQSLSAQVYIEKKHALLLTINSIRNGNVATISNISKLDSVQIPEEILNLKTKDDYDSEEDFLAARRAMVNTNLATDNIESALDDIDFDI